MSRQTLASTLVTDSYGLTLRGRLRSHNEDAILWPPLTGHDIAGRPFQLMAVADGVGGAPLGEVASSTAIATLRESFRRVTKEPAEALRAAFFRANRAVLEATRRKGAEGSATTLVAVLLNAKHAWIANVGDSRAYLLRGRAITQITEDHVTSVSGGSARAPGNVFLTRALGDEPAPEVDVFGPLDLRQGDLLVLCTDGLHGVVSPSEIAEGLNAAGLRTGLECLSLAASRRGADDISIIACRIH